MRNLYLQNGFWLAAAEIALRWRNSRSSQRGPCASDTKLDSPNVMSTQMDKTSNAVRIDCANTAKRAHTNSLDAHDKLIQTRSHVWNTIASRKWRFAMRKRISTIPALDMVPSPQVTEVFLILAVADNMPGHKKMPEILAYFEHTCSDVTDGVRGRDAPWQAKCKNRDPFRWHFDI